MRARYAVALAGLALAAGFVAGELRAVPVPTFDEPAVTVTAPPAGAGGIGELATVTSVSDGDTFRVRLAGAGEPVTVRVFGLDTPETRDPRKPVQCYGPEASRRAGELLPAGVTVTLTPDPAQDERDRYGRLLRYVTLPDGRDMAEVLIAEGFGRRYVYDEPVSRDGAYVAAEREAQLAGRGLWSPATCAGGL